MWRSVDGRTGDGASVGKPVTWRRWSSTTGSFLTYLWSAVGIWRATPVILARGSIQDDREYEIVVHRVNNDGPDRLQVSDRDALKRIADEHERKRKAARRRSKQGQQMRRLPRTSR